MDLSESPSTSDIEWLDKILGAHPRLGEKKVESAQSKAEQAQLNTGSEEEAAKLRDLNAEYEKTFPGLKYVYGDQDFGPSRLGANAISSVFVDRRSRPVIMENMLERIARGDIKLERTEAIKVRHHTETKICIVQTNSHYYQRQCVTSQQTAQLNFKQPLRYATISPESPIL